MDISQKFIGLIVFVRNNTCYFYYHSFDFNSIIMMKQNTTSFLKLKLILFSLNPFNIYKLNHFFNIRIMIRNKCQTEIEKYAQEMIEYSGRFIFRKGNEQGCINHQALKYALIELGSNQQDTGAYIGICAPRSCNQEAIKDNINTFLQKIKSSLDIYSLSVDPQNYKIQMNWVSFITLFILMFLVIAAIVVTLRNAKKKNKGKKNIFDAFDINKNIDYFKIRENENLNIFDGVRAVSMMWVVFGHTYLFFLGSGLSNLTSVTQTALKPFFLIIQGGIFSVDVFFMLGGFFLAYVYLKQKNNKISFGGLAITQRILRIWPAYILCMFIYYSLFMQFGAGIFWQRAYGDTNTCSSSLWTQILFIGNFVGNGQNICLGWGWYLQVEFQLFLFGVFILLLYYRSKALSFTIGIILSIGSTIFVLIYTYIKEVKLYTALQDINNMNYFLNVYIKPWGRCTSYFMGLILGIMYTQYRNKNQQQQIHSNLLLTKIYNLCYNRKIRIAIQWVGIGLMSLMVFIPRNIQTGSNWPQLANSLYWGFSRAIFVLGTILTILPTILGHTTSFFNLILTSKLLHFIARISFCTYLIHLMVIYQFTYTRNYDVYYTIVDTFVIYLGLLVVSLFFGFLMTVFVELPFAKLQKQLIQVLGRKKKNENRLLQLNQSLDSIDNKHQQQQQ